MKRSTPNLSNVWFKVTDLDVATGQGSWVTTTDGDRYLDFTGGIAVTATGHCHPVVVSAIARQAERFIHAQANIYTHDLLQFLAQRLAELTPPRIDTFFFANSGAEIIEASVKLAKQATGRQNVIVFQGGFHGRTHQAMAMTTTKSVYRAGHGPLPSGIFVAPFPAVRAANLESEIDQALEGFDQLLATATAPNETAAIVIEPIIGEGGYFATPPRFLQELGARCKQHGMLFISDEIQTGFGRTGKMFAIDHYDIEPDVICMAKGIASGFPFSALGTRRGLDDLWPTGSHGGTYGGNPIGCAAALATIEILTEEGFLASVQARGNQLLAGLNYLKAEHPVITHTRGLGLMVAIDFDTTQRTADVIEHCLNHSNLITMTAGAKTLRFMPPLTVTPEEITIALAALSKALSAVT